MKQEAPEGCVPVVWAHLVGEAEPVPVVLAETDRRNGWMLLHSGTSRLVFVRPERLAWVEITYEQIEEENEVSVPPGERLVDERGQNHRAARPAS